MRDQTEIWQIAGNAASAVEMHPNLDEFAHGAEMRSNLSASGEGGQRVGGVDVAQLLRDIGEASAQESSVELFRLCLGAQRVLQQVLTDRAEA